MSKRPARFRPECELLEERLAPANATTPGAITTPFPTLNSISIDWAITGDDNNNGVVTVQYRPQGTSIWLQGMNLQRIPAGTNTTNAVSWPNQQSGSIFDLQPNTTYEIQLSLTDPDGGSTTPAIQTRTTRAVPTLAGLRTVSVNSTSTFVSALNNAQPGDIIDLADGTYTGPFSGSHDGTAANPIIIKSSTGNAILQGDGTNVIDLSNHNYYHLDNLQINNGRIKLNDAIGSAVTRCIIHSPGNAIVAYATGGTTPQSLYIADNQAFGSGTWQDSQLGANGNDNGDGIEINGPGHIVMNNYVHGFRDDISLADGVLADQHDIDILNNDIDLATDDGIEADWTQGNIRIMRNRITNAFDGISSQPAFGGPTYMIRNVMYNVLYTPFKLHNDSVGNVMLNNSVVKNGDALGIFAGAPISNALFENNLFIGGPGGTYGGFSNDNGGTPRVIDIQNSDATDFYLNDAFGFATGAFDGKIGSSGVFSTLAGLNALANADNNVQIDLSVFAASVAYPSNPVAGGELAPADLRLAAGKPAVDSGMVVPNVTDGFSGSAPDIGAYELGAAVPVYGPRPATVTIGDDFNRANSPTLGSNWQIPASFTSGNYRFQYRRQVTTPAVGFQVSSNQAASADLPWQVAADQFVGASLLNPTVQADVTVSSSQGVGLFARAQSNGDAYVARLIAANGGTAQILLYHGATNTWTVLPGSKTNVGTSGTLAFTITGGATPTLTLSVGGVQEVQVTGNTAITTAGGLGIIAWGPGGTFDNFLASGS
jgi:hypothetical protein